MIQFQEEKNLKTNELFALRIFPRGGKTRKAGNVVVYLKGGAVDINGSAKARDALRRDVADWTTAP